MTTEDSSPTLEILVPPLELCKQIPKGCFADSAMVWANNPKLGFQVMPRIFNTFGDNCEHHYEGIPAPTLAEIIYKLNNNADIWQDADGFWFWSVCRRDIEQFFNQINSAYVVLF